MNDYEKALAYLQKIETDGKEAAGYWAAMNFNSMHENVFHWAEWMTRNNPDFLK